MTTKAKLSLLALTLLVATLAGCADNPTRMNVQQQLPVQVQKNT